jgi:hypothetical protein
MCLFNLLGVHSEKLQQCCMILEASMLFLTKPKHVSPFYVSVRAFAVVADFVWHPRKAHCHG